MHDLVHTHKHAYTYAALHLSNKAACLRAFGTLRSSKSKLHVTCPWIAQLMTVLCLDLPHIQQTANPNLEQKEPECLINSIKFQYY